jgi:hypothetical protein
MSSGPGFVEWIIEQFAVKHRAMSAERMYFI